MICKITSESIKKENTFSKLYLRFKRPIFNYVRTRTREDEVAEELTQEVFLKVYRFSDSYRDGFAFTTWLWTIARNTVSDYLRGTRHTPTDSEIQGSQYAGLPDEIPCLKTNAEAMLLKKDQRKSFFSRVRSLPRLQKRVLWLRSVHQLSYAEISKKLNISLSAVKNLAYRGKAALVAASV